MSPRSYKQFCALARALDVIGDRWTLLIVRNLLLGPQSWSELRSHLPGMATNLLSARLEDLQREGLVEKSDEGYALTPPGETLEAPLFAIAEWGEANAFGPPREGEAVRMRYLFTSLRRKLKSAPRCAEATLEVSVDGATFAVRWGDAPTVFESRASPGAAAATRWNTDVVGLRTLLFTTEDVNALAARSEAFDGDIGLLTRLRSLTQAERR